MANPIHRAFLAMFLATVSTAGALAQVPPNFAGADAPPGSVTPSRAIGITHNCADYYPQIARRENQSGDVMIRYDVAADGSISNVRLLRSSGFDQLDRAAILCVSQGWRNTPATQDGVSIPSPNHRAIIRFTLHDAPSAPRPGRDLRFIVVLVVGGAAAFFALLVLTIQGAAFGAKTCPACGARNRSVNPFLPPKFCDQCGAPLPP